MITFVLPGYSPRNKEWAEEVAKNLHIEGQIRPVFWDHWTHPEEHLRPKEKAELISKLAGENEVNIIAKSVGTLVAAYVVKNIPDKIGKIILCGIPSTSEARLNIFREAFTNFPVDKIIVYQNDHDPFKNPTEIKEFMLKVNPEIKVIAKPRNDHHYPYHSEFNEFLAS